MVWFTCRERHGKKALTLNLVQYINNKVKNWELAKQSNCFS